MFYFIALKKILFAVFLVTFFFFYCHDKYDYDNSHKNVDGMKNNRNGINNYDIMNHYFDYKYTIKPSVS